jgi:uncharacterized membrane protein
MRRQPAPAPAAGSLLFTKAAPMRVSLLIGILLIVGGAVLTARGFAYTANRSVLKVGDFEASLEEKRTVSPWFGVAAIAAGVVIIVAGQRRGGAS